MLPNAAERRQQARNNLKQKLLETLAEPRSQTSGQFEAILKQARDQVSTALQQSLGGSRLGLDAFHNQLLKTKQDLQQQALRLS